MRIIIGLAIALIYAKLRVRILISHCVKLEAGCSAFARRILHVSATAWLRIASFRR